MKPMMQNRYVGWMAVRPLQFGDERFEPGDRVPQRLLDPMRDPEVLVRTGRLAAVAKDMNKVPRYLRKNVTDEAEMREKIGQPTFFQIGEIVRTAQIPVALEGDAVVFEETPMTDQAPEFSETETITETITVTEPLDPNEEPADVPVEQPAPVDQPVEQPPAEPAPAPVEQPTEAPAVQPEVPAESLPTPEVPDTQATEDPAPGQVGPIVPDPAVSTPVEAVPEVPTETAPAEAPVEPPVAPAEAPAGAPAPDQPVPEVQVPDASGVPGGPDTNFAPPVESAPAEQPAPFASPAPGDQNPPQA